MDMVIGFGGVPSAAVRASAGRDGAAGAKKICEIGVDFSFAALWVFRLRRAEAASAVWIPHSLGAFRIGRDAGGEAVREREPRIPNPPGWSQGAQRAVFCAV